MTSGLEPTRFLVELVESFLKVVREDLRGNEELSVAGSILNVTKIAWQRTFFLSTTYVAECMKQRESQASVSALG